MIARLGRRFVIRATGLITAVVAENSFADPFAFFAVTWARSR